MAEEEGGLDDLAALLAGESDNDDEAEFALEAVHIDDRIERERGRRS